MERPIGATSRTTEILPMVMVAAICMVGICTIPFVSLGSSGAALAATTGNPTEVLLRGEGLFFKNNVLQQGLVASVVSTLSETFIGLWQRFEVWALAGYHQAPALMLGLVAALALPPLAIAGFLLRSGSSTRAASAFSEYDDVPKSIPVSSWQQKAWLEVLADDHARFDIVRDLIRIGREEDNDLRISHPTVHRYHAVIERSANMVFTIVDISGVGGNGMRIGGESAKQARLRGGEIIEVGNVRLRFHLTTT